MKMRNLSQNQIQPDGNKNNKEEDIRAVAEAVEVTGRSDAKRKSRSGKNPSSMLYGDNRINKVIQSLVTFRTDQQLMQLSDVALRIKDWPMV